MILALVGLIAGAAPVVLFLHGAGVIEHECDYDGPIEGWDGTWGQRKE